MMQSTEIRSARDGASPPAARGPAIGGAHDHTVQFYEDERFLCVAVGDFLADGLAAGRHVVVVATPAHRQAFSEYLRARGFDVGVACQRGQLVLLDARDTLARFMIGAVPDRARFLAEIGAILARGSHANGHGPVCVYGEMVDLLWKDGNLDGAIRVEELWNELATTHAFSLLCAYAMDNFADARHAHQFEAICREHGHVLPTERYTEASDDARLIEITLLQQRARALEHEIAQRTALERQLRDALEERCRAEAAVSQREAELKEFLENAVEGIHWVARDGTILWANRAELELLGYAPEEYIGHHIAEFHANQAIISDMLARLTRKETLREYEASLRCKDGSIRHVLVSSNVLWRDGEFVHTRCFTRDITDLKRAAVERERLLRREQAARAEAEAANRAKSEFLAVMSHELRTPLNAIGGHVQLVELGVHGPVTEAQRDALARVQRSQRHLLALINDVLNLARIETGRVEYAIDDVPVAEVAADITSMVEPLLSANRLTCEIARPARDGAGDAPMLVRADREKVQQILLNLVTNAIKFTPAGGHIVLEMTPCPGVPAMACVHVRDTGIGIPAAKLESIFEPFVQLGARPFTQQEGVGLGLAISRDLARKMGGDLTATSAPGDGTTLTLTLPMA